MDLNTNVRNFLKASVPEWTFEKAPSRQLLSRTVRHIANAKEDTSNIADQILKLETLIRTCDYLDEMIRKHVANPSELLKSLKDAKLKNYQSDFRKLGIKEIPNTEDIKKQLVSLTKKYSIPLRRDLNTKDQDGMTPFLRALQDGDLERIKFLKSLGAKIVTSLDEGNTLFHRLPKNSSKELIEFFLQEGVNINAKNQDGITPLIQAINAGNEDLAILLIESGANLQEKQGEISLHLACRYGFSELVKALIKNRVTLDEVDSAGNTPLLSAICCRNKECAKILIQNGANTTTPNNKKTPLHAAILYGLKEISSLLIQMNVNVNAKDNEGNTPLNLAAAKNVESIIIELIQHGALIGITNHENKNPVHVACENGRSKNLNELLSFSSKELINSKDSDGNTPLHLATQSDNALECIDLLLQHGAETQAINNEGKNILHTACENSNYKALQKLLAIHSSKELINSRDNDGNTPLYVAIYSDEEKNTLECIDLLIKHGAKTTILNKENKTSLHLACDNLSSSALEKLLPHSIREVNDQDVDGNTPLHLLLLNDDDKRVLQCISLLMEYRVKINIFNNKNQTPLHLAAANGYNEALKEFLTLKESKEIINSKSQDGDTPLHLAICNDNEDEANLTATLLLQHGADISVLDKENRSLIHDAAENGYNYILRKLLVAEGAAQLVNSQDASGNTPLLLALENENPNLSIKLLLKHGAKVDVANKKKTALHIAAATGAFEALNILLSSETASKAHNEKDTDGNTPLMLALKGNHKKCADLMLQHSVEVGTTNKDRSTALHFACKMGYFDLVKTLLKKCPDLLNKRDIHGDTPLTISIKNGHENFALFLIKQGANVEECDDRLRNPLHLACKEGLSKVVEILKENTNLINAQDKDGNTPILTAMENRKRGCVDILVENNASLSIGNNKKETPLHSASDCNFYDLIPIILEKHPELLNAADIDGYTPILLAVNSDNEECVKILIEHNANLGAKNKNGSTVVHLSSENNNLEILELLLEHAPKLLNSVDNYNETPLTAALENGHEECAVFLIDNNANLDFRFEDGSTALHKACEKGFLDIALAIIKNNPRLLNSKDNNGNTPLISALIVGQKESAKMLIKYGANVDITNYEEKTALHIASEQGLVDVVRLILSKSKNSLNLKNKYGNTPLDRARAFNHSECVELLIKSDVGVEPKKETSINIDRKFTKEELKDIFCESFKEFLESTETESEEVVEEFSDELDAINNEANLEKCLSLYMNSLFKIEKSFIEENLPECYKDRFEYLESTLDTLNDSFIEKEIELIKKQPPQTLTSLKEQLDNYEEKLHEIRSLFTKLSDEEKDQALLSSDLKNVNGDVYLGEGVCGGATLLFTSKRVNGLDENGIQPSKESRFYQVALDLGISQNKRFIKELEIKQTEKNALISLSREFVEKSSYRLTTSQCNGAFDILLKFANLLNDKELNKWTKEKKASFKYTDENFLELVDKIKELISAEDKDEYINESFKKRLGVKIESTQKISDSEVTQFIENLDSLILKLNTEKSSHFMLNMKGSVEDEHICYFHALPPYEIQDVDIPGFSIKSDDIQQFKKKLFVYFLCGAPESYDKIVDIFRVSKR